MIIVFFFMPTRDQPADVYRAEGEGVKKITSPRSSIFCEIIKSSLILYNIVVRVDGMPVRIN
jgi:hypothetical protein